MTRHQKRDADEKGNNRFFSRNIFKFAQIAIVPKQSIGRVQYNAQDESLVDQAEEHIIVTLLRLRLG